MFAITQNIMKRPVYLHQRMAKLPKTKLAANTRRRSTSGQQPRTSACNSV